MKSALVKLFDLVRGEPVVTAALVTAAVGAAAYFGFNLDANLVAAILAFAGFASAGVARSRVSPVRSVAKG